MTLPNLTKPELAGLAECAEWETNGPGMHAAWRPATMLKLEQKALVRKQPARITGHHGRWFLTDAGREVLAGFPKP